MILWDVSLCLYLLSVIEDTIIFKFEGVCVGIWVGLGWLSVIFFIILFYFYLCMF